MSKEITALEKANELINMYYGSNAKTQLIAIEQSERAVLTTLCQKIDDLHGNVVVGNETDENYVKPSIKVLKWWQEVAVELHNLKNKI